MTSQHTEERPFRFLDLPGEVRNVVYSHIFGEGDEKGHTRETLTPGLLQTCRQINDEATPLLYNNTLWVIVPKSVQQFRHLLPETLSKLQYIYLNPIQPRDGLSDNETFRVYRTHGTGADLGRAAKLRRLTIRFECPNFWHASSATDIDLIAFILWTSIKDFVFSRACYQLQAVSATEIIRIDGKKSRSADRPRNRWGPQYAKQEIADFTATETEAVLKELRGYIESAEQTVREFMEGNERVVREQDVSDTEVDLSECGFFLEFD